MAGILWASFKYRMGQAEGINMGFDLNHLIQPIPGLEELSLPFSDEEINKVLKELRVDRAPGPDGFNGMFVKRYWPIIEEDFLRMIHDFYEGKLSLENINSSLITLIPKIISPEGPDDFRPISLTNTCLKFLTKLLANRLQRVILKCIHKNQYGFLKGSSSVLLNGILGKQFLCKCGIRQGDPLSPLLFVIAADLLQSVVNQMLVTAKDDELVALKNMLLTFQQSTGLKLPFTYLGLPLGTTRPRIIDLMPLVDSLERSLNIPAGIIKQLDRIFRQCLWRGNSDVPKQSLAAWELVCRPRDKGGLGIINLNIQNKGMLLKHLHKFYNKVDVPWVTLIWNSYYDHGVPQATANAGSFWWRDVLKLHEAYTAIASSKCTMKIKVFGWLLFFDRLNTKDMLL
ncbi:uncharacterized protein [Aegilops tauschii subsp. strangulata]|uniref:uncharacterized protein n=1 Tax=Aegilops tauschii subsp. strangulata TaxID=200361 RepID=UPI003CC8D657